jgi:hypothetical protein
MLCPREARDKSLRGKSKMGCRLRSRGAESGMLDGAAKAGRRRSTSKNNRWPGLGESRVPPGTQ